MRSDSRVSLIFSALMALVAVLCSCGLKHPASRASILFTRVPEASEGGYGDHDFITGKVIGAQPGQRLVLYSKSGKWWLQPLASRPFTKVQPNSQWVNSTHLGTEYAALLVSPGYTPAVAIEKLPEARDEVIAVAATKGQPKAPSPVLTFSGYDWIVRDAPSDRGGVRNLYNPANAWTDKGGALHLRMSKTSGEWSCAEISLTRSLGFGTYVFSVRDTSHIDPSAVFGMFTWDWAGAEQNYTELDIEVSRWGNPEAKNAQYVVQPFYIPENVFRFSTPGGRLTHQLEWKPGRVSFTTTGGSGKIVAHHEFTSSVPSPGLESVRMNLYPFQRGKLRSETGAEVVVDKFEFLP